MKKTLLLTAGLLLATLTLHANSDGNTIYETNCKACHLLKPTMDKATMMKLTPAERMAMKQKMMKTMKAPPLSKVSAKLKHDFHNDKAQVVAFVQDYIVNPDANKSHCMPMALKRFGTMPPIGKGMRKADVETIANWIYDNFDSTWSEMTMGTACHANDANTTAKKCGTGKCATGKCGGATPPKPAMKCAPGKCGGGK